MYNILVFGKSHEVKVLKITLPNGIFSAKMFSVFNLLKELHENFSF